MLGIAEYFWRLLPANPILLRVVQMNGKRRRDLFIRCGYLALLIAVFGFSLVNGSTGNLSELSNTSRSLFRILSYCQLGLVALLAPIFTAGAITQEKDSQTYDILLATPLTNGQILLGSLMSRLFFVIALLISGVPIFSMMQLFGGVAIHAIVQSFLIATATALVTGAVAMAIAVLKVGTRRTIFSFYLFIVLYMVGTFMLDQIPYFKIGVLNPANNVIENSKTSWLTGLNPFLALSTLFHDPAYTPPAVGDLPVGLQKWPMGWYLSNPANFYITFMFTISLVLITPSIVLLRRLAQSTTSFKTLLFQKLKITRGDRTRKPRTVWSNPIAWREARTKASAARASVLRYGFVIGGLVGALAIVVMFATYQTPKYPNFIDSRSYNSALGQLTVYDAAGSGQTLPLDPSLPPDDPRPKLSIVFTDPQTEGEKADHVTIASVEELFQRAQQDRIFVSATPRTAEIGGRTTDVAWTSIDAYAPQRRLGPADARTALLGAVVVEFAVILLIVTNAAASTVTREKEDGTLDLLLSTPITSRYYIWGKLRGLVSFVLPLVAVPVLSAAMFVVFDSFRRFTNWNNTVFQWTVLPESIVLLPGMLVIVVAFASILGMQMSLRMRKTVVAVMSSIGIVSGICAAMGLCGYRLLQGNGASESMGIGAAAFSPFTLLTVLIDPYSYTSTLFRGDANATSTRLWMFVLTWIAVGVYTLVVWTMYKSMVKNFDMTIRKQSR